MEEQKQEQQVETPEYDGLDDGYSQRFSQNIHDVGIAQLQIDSEQVINAFKMELTGTAIDKDGQLIQIDKTPLCNMEGANKLVPYIRASLSKTVTLGKLKSKQINNLMYHLGNDLVIQLAKNYKRYEIKFSHLSEVKEITCAYMETNFSRSEDGFTSKLIGKQMNINEVRHIQESPEKKGFFGFGRK